MHEYKGIKYYLNFHKEWFYSNSLKTKLKPLNAKSFQEAKKEVEAKINESLKNKNK